MTLKRELLFILLAVLLWPGHGLEAQNQEFQQHVVVLGDTWAAISLAYQLDQAALQETNPHINRQRQPAIGSVIRIPAQVEPRNGRLIRSDAGGLVQLSLQRQVSPWVLAIYNGIGSPFLPLLGRPLLAAAESGAPRDLPTGFSSFEVSQLVARPGIALAFRGTTAAAHTAGVALAGQPFSHFVNGPFQVGLIGTGAFYSPGEPELTVTASGAPLWAQPWRFQDTDWSFQQITLTGAAAAIDQESIARERERLFALWSLASPNPLWSTPFTTPVQDFLDVSSAYGARRSYNGGPYSSYHEGVDYSAYGGTPVAAPAAGRVALAEQLYVRGGAVILDHGLGVFTGYYHMAEVNVAEGDRVDRGDILGLVGTTGLSTGNHLHWDMLVNGVWVDAAAWTGQNMGCWILEGYGTQCVP